MTASCGKYISRFAGNTAHFKQGRTSPALLRECRAGDAESASVLEAYLDRYHADTWRAAAAGEAEVADQAMTREQAYLILGLKPGAGDQAPATRRSGRRTGV